MCVQVCAPGKSKGCYDCCLAFIYHFFNTHELEGQPWGALVKAKLQSCEWIQWGLMIIKSMRPRIRPLGTESHLWKKKKKEKTGLAFALLRLSFRRRQWHTTRVLLPGKPMGRGAWCSPWGHKELDTTERLSSSRLSLLWENGNAIPSTRRLLNILNKMPRPKSRSYSGLGGGGK